MADGGCSSPGDVAKAFAATGADFVMLGGMLAGHDESGGELVEGDNGEDVQVILWDVVSQSNAKSTMAKWLSTEHQKERK